MIIFDPSNLILLLGRARIIIIFSSHKCIDTMVLFEEAVLFLKLADAILQRFGYLLALVDLFLVVSFA